MRDYDEEDPKKPQPVRILKKGSNPTEASEAVQRATGSGRAGSARSRITTMSPTNPSSSDEM